MNVQAAKDIGPAKNKKKEADLSRPRLLYGFVE